MKKIYLFMLMAVGLLISGNLRAQNVAKIGTQEYATLAEAIAAATGTVDAGNVIELLEDIQASELAITGKAVIIKHKINNVEHIKGSEIGGWQLAQAINSECIVKRGDWKYAVIVGDFEKCIDLEENYAEINSLDQSSNTNGSDGYFVGKSITLTKDIYIPQPCYAGTHFCGGETPLILDLAGHTYEQKLNPNQLNNVACLNVKTGSLTITGNGRLIGTRCALAIEELASVTMENGTIAGRGDWRKGFANDHGGYDVMAQGPFTMLGGTIGDNSYLLPNGKKYCSLMSWILMGDDLGFGGYNWSGVVNIQGGVINGVPEGYRDEMGDCSVMVWDQFSVMKTASTIADGTIMGDVQVYGSTTIQGNSTIEGVVRVTDFANKCLIAEGKYNKIIVHKEAYTLPIISGGKFKTDQVDVFSEQQENFTEYSYMNDGLDGYEFDHTEPLADYVMDGYEVIANPDADADVYPWLVRLANPTDPMESNMDDGSRKEWKEAWGKADEEFIQPTATTPTTINTNHHVYVADNTVANAYSVTINPNTTLTVKKGGTLVVGAGGVNGANEGNFIVEDGAIVAISPAVAEARPTGTVKYVAKYAGQKQNVSTPFASTDLYWEQIAIPTVGKPDAFTSVPSYFNTWDITEAWQAINRDNVDAPFKGFFISNETEYSENEKNNEYVFEGTMVGNQVNIMNFAREGFTFFGNSYTAPIGMFELLCELNVDNVEATVYIYRPLEETYYAINLATVGRGGRPTEINPMKGFFVYAADKALAKTDYKSTVWDVLQANLQMVNSAPKHNMIIPKFDAEATLTINAANGLTDELVLFEDAQFTSAFDQNYDARKMMNKSGLNMYVPGNINLAILATDALVGTPIAIETTTATEYTISFANVVGDYALLDTQTGISTKLADGATYSFTAPANTTISDRFTLVSVGGSITNEAMLKANKNVNNAIFSIMGQYIGDASQWRNLPQGVYIKDGQKIIK